jgi:hypothetical protein
MTTWTDELKKIRRAIRDPDGKIWTDQFLQHMWNDVQQDFQSRTSVLENVLAQRVPDLYHMSYMHDWEWHYLPTDITEFYQCLSRHSGNTFMHLLGAAASGDPRELCDHDDHRIWEHRLLPARV